MIRFVERYGLGLLLALLLAGCSTNSGKLAGGTVHIALQADGRVSVDNHTVEIAKVAKSLKSLGATPTTTIVVAVPRNVSTAMLSEVTRSLASAGFQKIMFTKPVEVEASVVDGKSASPAASTPARTSKPKSTSPQKPVRSGTL